MSTAHWPPGVPTTHDPERWFRDHFDNAADEIIAFLAGDGIEVKGKRIADIGCGDGIIDLGVLVKGEPELLVGYDLRPTDAETLGRIAAEHGHPGVAADQRLSFMTSEPAHIPAVPDAFDIVFSWSTFEHVSEPGAMLREIRRVLKPTGVLLLQVWPLFHSLHGGHLWLSVREPFAHLIRSPSEVEARLDGQPATDPTRGSALEEFRSLNRLTLDDLQRALLSSGFRPTKVKATTETFHVPLEVAHMPLSQLSISGIQLLAAPV